LLVRFIVSVLAAMRGLLLIIASFLSFLVVPNICVVYGFSIFW